MFSMAQGEGNIWHFGNNAGIDFNSGTAVAINGPVHTSEGSASICNASGALLFSTDGVTVYDANSDTMDTGLYGHNSTSQSALIVPDPGNNNRYYVFTADYGAFSHGINYSIVDMSLNGGLGSVVLMNSPLLTPASEKLTAVKNTNGTDYWVVAHAYPNNEFYVYPVSSSGVGLPVISTIGLPIVSQNNVVGCIKFSPDGQKIASASCNLVNEPVELFDFDAATGLLSNYITIPGTGNSYGLSFSPDNSKLYISFIGTPSIDILQYDLTVPNFQNFPDTIMIFSTYFICSLQLAPDGKIYCAKYGGNKLGVINNPNLSGALCGYNDLGFTLATGSTTTYGLPNYFEGYPVQNCFINPVSTNTDLLCKGINTGAIDITLSGGTLPITFLWNTGATTEDLSNLFAGNYSVTITDSIGCVEIVADTITEPLALMVTLNFSQNQDSIFASVNGGTPPYFYNWSNGATTAFVTNLSGGTYSVTITDANGCEISTNIKFSSIENFSSENNLSIYPNPVSEQLIVDNGQWLINEIKITDILGRIITGHFHLTAVPYSVDVSNFSEGIYFIKLVSSSGLTIVKKFVVVH